VGDSRCAEGGERSGGDVALLGDAAPLKPEAEIGPRLLVVSAPRDKVRDRDAAAAPALPTTAPGVSPVPPLPLAGRQDGDDVNPASARPGGEITDRPKSALVLGARARAADDNGEDMPLPVRRAPAAPPGPESIDLAVQLSNGPVKSAPARVRRWNGRAAGSGAVGGEGAEIEIQNISVQSKITKRTKRAISCAFVAR